MIQLLLQCLALITIVVVNARAADSQSFTPTQVRLPLRAVYLSGPSRSVATFYQCESEALADCMIDLTDPAALRDLFSALKPVPVGTYDEIIVQNCLHEGGYTAQVKGSATIGGSTYYTESGENILTENQAEQGPVTLSFSGCQRNYKLPEPITVAKGTEIEVSLFVPLTRIAWMNLGLSTIPSGCVENADGTRSVCMGYPDAMPYLGKTVPKLETYSIFETPGDVTTAGGQVLLLFDANDHYIGGSTHRLFQPNTVAPHGNYDTPVWVFEANGDGTYHIENYGSSSRTSYLVFPEFRRGSHSGKFQSLNWGGQWFDYAAEALTENSN